MRINRIGSLLLFLSMTLFTRVGATARQRQLERKTGTVIYVTPMNIYVQFRDTRGIVVGDTLFADRDGRTVPALIAKYMSSLSCAGPIIGKVFLKTGDHIYALVKPSAPSPSKPQTAGHEVDTSLAVQAAQLKKVTVESSPASSTISPRLHGGLTVNSSSNFSNFSNASNIQRWNYSMNMNADNIAGSQFSFSNYMYFSYLGSQWNQIATTPLSNLRVYNLALSYKTPGVDVWAGRYINNDISGVGPIDGIQAEEHWGSLTTGEVIGSRPDFYTLGFNPNLFQFGGYICETDTMSAGLMKNTLGLFQQYDLFHTDRRFIYFQHTSTLFSHFNFYASGQVDLFKLASGLPKNTFSLTDIYLTSVYFPINRLSVNLTYSAQRNIIYYQTFGSTLDSLLTSQNSLRQNIRFGTDFRPFPYTFIMIGGGYSFQQGDLNPTKDADMSVTQSNIPLLLISATVYYDRILSNYLDGSVMTLTLSKFIPFNSTSISVGYSRVKYTYGSGSLNSVEIQPDVQLTTRLFGNLFLNLYYQGTYTGPISFGTFMGGLTEQF